jgi:glycosyltransferase involved in cell wall biosynthesis
MKMTDSTFPLVTIAVPTYNRADSYLKLAIQSAVAQTYPNIEIIVSDNCSTDNTETLVRSFNDSRIRYLKQSRNIGMLNNSNFCLDEAKGAYFMQLHDDDLIDHDFVSVCMKAVNNDTNVGIIITGTRVIDEEGKVICEDTNKAEGCSTTDFMLSWFRHDVPLYLCSTLYNTRRLKELGGFKSKTNHYEDCVALFQLAAKFGRKDIHDVKASFRRHSHNTGSAASIKDWCEDSHYLLDIMCNLAGDKKELVSNAGMRYFCRVNYNYIRSRNIRSQIERWSLYWFVYKTFGYVYSPIEYVFGKDLFSQKNAHRLLSYLKRKTREAWSRAPAQ